MHGLGPFRQNLEEKLDLTTWITEELRTMPQIEIVAEPQISIVAFRLARPGLSTEELNNLNRTLLEKINSKQRVFLTGTTLNGRFVIRICVVSFRTHMNRMQAARDDIRTSIEELPL
jgi:aromatic-L-amino-acid decarboxylase